MRVNMTVVFTVEVTERVEPKTLCFDLEEYGGVTIGSTSLKPLEEAGTIVSYETTNVELIEGEAHADH